MAFTPAQTLYRTAQDALAENRAILDNISTESDPDKRVSALLAMVGNLSGLVQDISETLLAMEGTTSSEASASESESDFNWYTLEDER